MSFLKRLRAAWLYTRFAPYIVEADAETFWTESDARWLATMFDSYSGRKLRILLTNHVTKTALNAIRTNADPYSIGVAAGVDLGVRAMDNYFPQVTAHSDETETSSDDAALDALELDAA